MAVNRLNTSIVVIAPSMRPSVRRIVSPHDANSTMTPTAGAAVRSAASSRGRWAGRAAGLLRNPANSKPQFRAPRNAPRHSFHAVIHLRSQPFGSGKTGEGIRPHLGHNGLFYGPADASPQRRGKPDPFFVAHAWDFRFGSGLRARREEW